MQRLLLELEEEEDGAGVMGMVNPVTICDFAAILRDAHKFNYCQETDDWFSECFWIEDEKLESLLCKKKKLLTLIFVSGVSFCEITLCP